MVAFPWSLDVEPPPTTAERKRWRFFERHLPNLSIGLMVLTLVAAVLYPYMVITVPSGHVGVLWKRFNGFGIQCWCWVGRGTVLNPLELRKEGLHLIWPWDRLFIYDERLQTATETYNAISKEGVSLSATINIRFQLRHNSVAVLHKFIGPAYEEWWCALKSAAGRVKSWPNIQPSRFIRRRASRSRKRSAKVLAAV